MISKFSALLLLTASVAGMAFSAVTLPYSNDFSADAADFVPGVITNTSWAVNTTTGTYVNSITAATELQAYSVVQAPLGGTTNQNFLMQTTYRVTDPSNNYTVGFAALGATAALGSNYYLADINNGGTFRIYNFATGQPLVSVNVGAVSSANSYTLSLMGIYNESGGLSLSFNITGGTLNNTITADIAAPLTGTYFGYRNRVNNTGPDRTLTVEFDSFSINAVPEPGVTSLAGLALGALVLRRRRGVCQARGVWLQ